MKFLVVLAVAVACVAADVSYVEPLIPIVRSSYEISPDSNSFQYAYETGNKIYSEAQGVVKNPQSNEPTLEVKGTYKYYSPEGAEVLTSYIANEDGFQPTGSHIPVAPPVPEAILRSLAYIEAHRPAVERTFKP